jgi:hypothetical protein
MLRAMASPRSRSTATRPRRSAGDRLQEAERDLRFSNALHAACLKSGAAAAISSLSGRLPLIGRLAPVVLGSIAESSALVRIQHQLVDETLEIYAIELGEAERQGVVLIATAANVTAQEFSRTTLNRLVRDVAGDIGSAVLLKMLPLAGVVAEVAAAIASTYSVGRRTQALSRFGQDGPRNLGELLRGLSGIDENRLLVWTQEAMALALSPFRRVLAGIRPPPIAAEPAAKARRPAKRAAGKATGKAAGKAVSKRRTPRGSRD